MVTSKAPKTEELPLQKDRLISIYNILSEAEIEVSDAMRVALEYLDREIIKALMSPEEYSSVLRDFAEYLDESL